MSRVRVGCLIPAYNEAARIGRVLAVAAGHPLIDRVLVVDDGSTDGTAEVARAAGAAVLAMPRNGGKTAAVAAGIEALDCDWLLMLDSDLEGLDREALSALLLPVLRGEAKVSISLRGNAPLVWRLIGLDYISGERVLPRAQLAPRTEALRALPRFGIEVFLNRIWIAEQSRLAIVPWPRVSSPSKARKRGLLRGLLADLAMLADIFRTIPATEAARQILALRRQSGRPARRLERRPA
ncbi:glycosyltransferase family 2 protein [Rhodobacter sp. NSM]|uniref:glycosyltransferase family 2 protein n=1 Tax=Rhodobacter sp. NSM TaxID=3457501 RepID=UPI003FD1AF3F